MSHTIHFTNCETAIIYYMMKTPWFHVFKMTIQPTPKHCSIFKKHSNNDLYKPTTNKYNEIFCNLPLRKIRRFFKEVQYKNKREKFQGVHDKMDWKSRGINFKRIDIFNMERGGNKVFFWKSLILDTCHCYSRMTKW